MRVLRVRKVSQPVLVTKLVTEVESSVYPSLHYTHVYRKSPKQCRDHTLFLHLFLWNILTADTYYISFRCTKWWLTIYMHYKLITMISLGNHLSSYSYWNIIDSILYAVNYILVTYYNYTCSYFLIPFTFFIHPLLLPLWESPHFFSVSMNLFLFYFVLKLF